MPDPHPDHALDALLARYVPGSMLDSAGTSELVAQVTRLRTERDQAVHDAAFLAQCAAQLMHGGDALLEECAETVLEQLQRLMRRRFDVLRVVDVMNRYADVDPVTAQEHDAPEVANG